MQSFTLYCQCNTGHRYHLLHHLGVFQYIQSSTVSILLCSSCHAFFDSLVRFSWVWICTQQMSHNRRAVKIMKLMWKYARLVRLLFTDSALGLAGWQAQRFLSGATFYYFQQTLGNRQKTSSKTLPDSDLRLCSERRELVASPTQT